MRFLYRLQSRKEYIDKGLKLQFVETIGEVVLRHMKPHELHEVIAIETKSFPDPWGEMLFRTELGNPFSKNIVVHYRNNKKLLGYNLFWIMFNEVHILNLAVDPACRQRGLGKLLIKKAISMGKNMGANKATLEVRMSNHTAIYLYKKMGFKIMGERPRYYIRTNENAYIMVIPDLSAIKC